MNDEYYLAATLAEWFGVSGETIRRWSIEFKAHLSPEIQTTEEGETRQFTELDARKLAYIAQLRRANKRYPNIHADLQNVREDLLPTLDDYKLKDMIQTSTSHDLEEALRIGVELRNELEESKQKIRLLEDQLAEARANASLVKFLQEQLQAAQQENARLNQQIGVMRSRLGEL